MTGGRTPAVVLFAAVLAGGAAPAVTRADGGTVQLRQAAGPFVVTVLTSPTPLRAGPVDVSVMVQELAAGAPVLDAAVRLELIPEAGGRAIVADATRARATNKLLYAALVDLPAPGNWQLRATVRRGEASAEVACRLETAARRPAVVSFWPWLALPPAVGGLFALNQWLGDRRRRARGTAAG